MNPDTWSILGAVQRGSLVLAVALVLLVTYILCLRVLLLLRQRRYRDLCALWTPILLGGETSGPLPVAAHRDRLLLLILWNALREQHERAAAIRGWMERVAALTRLDRFARQLLRKRSVRRKLLAIVTLGQLRDASAWHELCEIARSEHPLLALAATRAIACIDPARATETAVSLVVGHPNWPAAKVAGILGEIGPERLSEPLARAVLQAQEPDRTRLVPLLSLCRYSTALPAVRRILGEPHPDEVIAACLQVIGKFRDPQDLPLVYDHLTHARWHVRAIAAGCLGNMGRLADQHRLAPLLTDRHWWVRYRAAEAIVSLSPHDEERLHDIQRTLSDRYARDILTQVFAERTRRARSDAGLPPAETLIGARP